MAKKSKKAAPAKSSVGSDKKSKKPSGKKTWKMMDKASTIGGGIAARKMTALTWQAATGKKPPGMGATRHPDLQIREAVTWTVFAGATTELVKLLLRRKAAGYWIKSTGHLPPGMKPIDDAESQQQAETSSTEPEIVETPGKRKGKRSAKKRK